MFHTNSVSIQHAAVSQVITNVRSAIFRLDTSPQSFCRNCLLPCLKAAKKFAFRNCFYGKNKLVVSIETVMTWCTQRLSIYF